MENSSEMLTQSVGLPPGTPIFVGTKKLEQSKMTLIEYDQEHLLIGELQHVKDAPAYKDSPAITWLNIDGIHDAAIVESIGKHFGLHPLIIEDILNTQQRLKIEIFDNYLVIILKMFTYDTQAGANTTEQVSIVLGENFVLTFQEQKGDVFETIRNRLRHNLGRIRRARADYLAYALLDAIVDSYFEVVERLGEQIELVEEDVIQRPGREMLRNIYALRRELIFFRKAVWPLRTMITQLLRQETSLFHDSTLIYLRDAHDHIIQILETIETFRDMMTGVLDVYLSSVSNKMNEVMKFLTIIGTLFIPLTFIAGIYGMNFQYMPELSWKWGYFTILLLMFCISIALLGYFKKKKWL